MRQIELTLPLHQQTHTHTQPPQNRHPHQTADVVALFERCKAGLTADGLVVVKENVCSDGFVVDKDDHSLTRSGAYYGDLFDRAGLDVVASAKQRNFPKELFEVRMWALRPRGRDG
jgi:protein N-terminal methyltransferase